METPTKPRQQVAKNKGGRPKQPPKLDALKQARAALANIPPAPIPQKPGVTETNPTGGGRPPAITEVTLAKLEAAFMYGCSDGEACLYAGIYPSTLYHYQKDHPEFKERKDLLKKMPFLQARQATVASFPKRPDIALRFLEDRLPEEFSPKMKHEHEHTINLAAELRERSKKYEPRPADATTIEVPPPDLRGVESGTGDDNRA